MSVPAADAYDVTRALVRIEVKVDQLLADTGDHEQRIRLLEARSWPRQSLNTLVSVCAALVALVALVQGLITR